MEWCLKKHIFVNYAIFEIKTDETPIVTNLLQQVTKNQIIYFRSHHETQKFTSKFNHFILWVTMILRDNLLQWSPFENQFWTFERQPYKISSVRNLILSLLWCWCYQNQALNNVILGDGSQIWLSSKNIDTLTSKSWPTCPTNRIPTGLEPDIGYHLQ